MYSFRSFVVSILLILTAVVIAYASEACFVTHSYDPSGWPSSGECSFWSGCTDSDADGACKGIVRAEIGGRTTEFAIFSCSNAQKGTHKYCRQFPEADCIEDGTLTCLTFTAWSEASCHGESAIRCISSKNCRTQFR